jgi:ArsR family transcriptional regulator
MQQPQEAEIQLFHAQICQALADPTRILLLYRLSEGPQNVGELAAALKISQPTVSRHLKVLRERGMVTTTRYGATVEYRRSTIALSRRWICSAPCCVTTCRAAQNW